LAPFEWIRRGDRNEVLPYHPRRFQLRNETRRLSSSTINLPELAAGIRRVKRAKRIGVRLSNWLSAEQVKVLVRPPNTSRPCVVNEIARSSRFWLAAVSGELKPADIPQRDEQWVMVELPLRNPGSLAPDDLRRTCACLRHIAGGELEQIQFLPGHVSIQTTDRYLGCNQKLRLLRFGYTTIRADCWCPKTTYQCRGKLRKTCLTCA
jgi:integrase